MIPALSDRHALALTVYGESRSETVFGQLAVGAVIRNRVQDARWPNTYAAICLQPRQFSCWNEGDPNRVILVALADQWQTGQTPSDPILQQILYLTDGIIDGVLIDPTRSSNHYCTMHLYATKTPAWAKGVIPAITIGRHVFFRL